VCARQKKNNNNPKEREKPTHTFHSKCRIKPTNKQNSFAYAS